jgi:putative tryptophan/tyrosine transport system substrate-binding protein
MLEPFWAGLRELGYVDGQNLSLEYRYSGGQQERLLDLARELARLPLDLIVAEKADAVAAAKEATSTIPIVMAIHSDPLGTGAVASLDRPGGNVTGLSALAAQLPAKRIELLRQTSPSVSRVAIFYDHTYRPGQHAAAQAKTASDAFGLELLDFDVRTPADFDTAFEAARRAGVDGLLQMISDPFIQSQRNRIVEFAAQHRLASMHSDRAWVIAGGLMAYGASYPAIYRRSAYYVDRILKGAQPADLPVEQPTTFELVVNLRTARALGLTIPQHVLQQATEAVE